MLSEEAFDAINCSVGTAEEKCSVNFSKAKTEFCLSLHYSGDSGDKSKILNILKYLMVNNNKK